MDEIQIVQVDERDNNWENNHPRFRVYLHGSGQSTTHGWTDTYDITGADVLQVIGWWPSCTTTKPVSSSIQDVPGDLVWLVGIDGNTSAFNSEETQALQRMLMRRREPVGVPSADRMPPGVPDPYNDGTERR
jgi:hypothetical protein